MNDLQSLPEKAFPVSWDMFHRDARALAWRLNGAGPFGAIVAITRGGLVPALNLMGHYIPTMVKGRKGWDVVMDIVLLGRGEVRHITVGDRCFWAADAGSPGFILHHNLKPADE